MVHIADYINWMNPGFLLCDCYKMTDNTFHMVCSPIDVIRNRFRIVYISGHPPRHESPSPTVAPLQSYYTECDIVFYRPQIRIL
jgi:hypothetical protein